MDPTIEELTAAVEQEARKRPEVLRLMTHPGVGPVTALATEVFRGDPKRFADGLFKINSESRGVSRKSAIFGTPRSIAQFLLYRLPICKRISASCSGEDENGE